MSDRDLPGWVPPALAGAAVIGAFGLGMWFLGKETKVGALGVFGPLDPYYTNRPAPDFSMLERRYPTSFGISIDPATDVAVVWFWDEHGKPQQHDWRWTGSGWVCAKEES